MIGKTLLLPHRDAHQIIAACDTGFSTQRSQEKSRFDKEKAIWDARCDLVHDKATAVEDAIVLGDNAAALAALQDFAAFRV